MRLARRRSILYFSPLTLFIVMVFAPRAEVAQDTAAAVETPLSLALIFDLSQSTVLQRQGPTIKPKHFKQLFSSLLQPGSRNQFFIISMSTAPKVILDGSTDGKATLKALSKLAAIERGGATALYDACFLGIKKVTLAEPSKRVLIAVSDGVDTMSRKTLSVVKRALVDAKVTLYAIVVKSEDKVFDERIKALDEMAAISGGEAFHPERSEDLKAILERIAVKLRE